jgi:zinc/manganese transport system ATP-binding protein
MKLEPALPRAPLKLRPLGDPILRLDSIGVRLGGRDVLTDVSLDLRPGEFLGIIGSNGAGKTTLLRLILGLLRPSHGTIRMFGHPPRRGDRSIGYVPQHQNLDPDLPIRARDFVRLGLNGDRWGMGLPNADVESHVDEALTSVGALSFAEAPVGRLSGGEQQRLFLAQALVGDPCLLLLDEPLANLDLRSRRDVVALVRRVSEERNIAVAFVAHDINPLLDSLDRVLYLANGRSVTGSVDDVITTEVLTRLYGFPVEVVRAAAHVLVVGAGENDDCHA